MHLPRRVLLVAAAAEETADGCLLFGLKIIYKMVGEREKEGKGECTAAAESVGAIIYAAASSRRPLRWSRTEP